jgi:hypothetical protein
VVDIYPPKVQREALLKLAEALGCRDNALRRDECGDWRIKGERGWIYAAPEGFQLIFFAREAVNEWDGDGPHIEDYTKAKRSLMFCRLAQDGTGEGIFILDRLPMLAEAVTIREIFAIAKKREVGEPSEAQLAARAAFAAKKRPTKGPENTTSEGLPPASAAPADGEGPDRPEGEN